jgi:DNA-binding Lrp family transcriptional regulator
VTASDDAVRMPPQLHHQRPGLHAPWSTPAIDAFQREVSALPEVMSVFVLAGGDDFLLHVGVPRNPAVAPLTEADLQPATAGSTVSASDSKPRAKGAPC